MKKLLIFLLAGVCAAQTVHPYAATDVPNLFINTNAFLQGAVLGPTTFAGLSAGLYASAQDGTAAWVSDGNPGNQCTSGGIGALAIRDNGVWTCLPNGGTLHFNGVPSGSCTLGQTAVDDTTNNFYYCAQTLTWHSITAGGSPVTGTPGDGVALDAITGTTLVDCGFVICGPGLPVSNPSSTGTFNSAGDITSGGNITSTPGSFIGGGSGTTQLIGNFGTETNTPGAGQSGIGFGATTGHVQAYNHDTGSWKDILLNGITNTGGTNLELDLTNSTGQAIILPATACSGTNPAPINFSGQAAGTGWFQSSNSASMFCVADAPQDQLGTAGMRVVSGNAFDWSSTSALPGTKDTGIGRSAAGIVSADTSTTGNALGSFQAATMIAGPPSGGLGGVPGLVDKSIGLLSAAMSAQSSASCTTVTNMTWTVAAGKAYVLRCSLPITFAASATIAFCLSGTTVTSHTIHAWDALGAAGVFGDVNLVNSATYGTKTSASGAVNGTQVIELSAVVRNATGTTLTLQTAADATHNITMLADGACTLTQAN